MMATNPFYDVLLLTVHEKKPLASGFFFFLFTPADFCRERRPAQWWIFHENIVDLTMGLIDAYGTHVMISVRIGHHIPHSEGKRSVLFPLSGANREELKASERFSAATPSSPSARERRWFGLKPRLSSLDGRGGMATATATAGDEAACAAISGFAWRTRTAIHYGSSLWGAATLQGIGAASFRIKLLDQTKKKNVPN